MAVKSGYKAISFYNSDDGTTVQIGEAALERVDFSQQEMEPDKTDPSGGSPYVGDLSELEVETWDFAGRSQLETWSKNNTRIAVVAIGVQGNVQWYNRDRVSISASPKSERGQANTFVISMRRRGQGEHNIYDNVNLLQFKGWEDADSDNVPDDYAANSLSSMAFTGGVFEAFGSTSTSSYLSGGLPMPVAGVTVTLSVDVVQLHADGDTRIRIIERDFAGSTLSTSTTTATSTGRVKTSLTTSPNVYDILVRPVLLDNVTSQTTKVRVKDPAFRIDGSDQYVNH